jgi:hypothetical protein
MIYLGYDEEGTAGPGTPGQRSEAGNCGYHLAGNRIDALQSGCRSELLVLGLGVRNSAIKAPSVRAVS